MFNSNDKQNNNPDESLRFMKVIKHLNSSSQKDKNNRRPNSSTDNSLLGELSMHSEKDVQNQNENRNQSKMTQKKALFILLDNFQAICNRIRGVIHTQFIPTSNGLKYVLIINKTYINISWIHSLKELETNKLLLLYYDISQLLKDGKPKIESLVLQFNRSEQMHLFYSAVTHLHETSYDQDVEKLYHLL